ncbi:MAG TPA: metallopeptidase family protein [Thermodesulfobacteriota bacterium]
MDRRSFEAVVEEALARLPEEFQARLDNVAVLVEDRPSRELLKSMGLPPQETLLGVYQGTPLPQRGPTTYGNVLPDRIVLFQEPIEEMGGGLQAIKRRIADTVVHEIGHYFGLSDDQMDDAEDELDATFGPDPAAQSARRDEDDDDDLDDEDLDDEDEDLDDEDLDEDDEDLDDEDLDEEDDEEPVPPRRRR